MGTNQRLWLLSSIVVAVMLAGSWPTGTAGAGGDFNPTLTVSVTNPAADSPTNDNIGLTIPSGDLNYSLALGFEPPAWQVTPGSDIKLGVPHASSDVVLQVGLMNAPCNLPLALHFDLLNATTDRTRTVTYEDGFADDNGDGNVDFIDMYPDFNDRVLGPAQPYLRLVGIADVAGTKLLLQAMSYRAGTTVMGRAFDPALGEPVVTLLNNTGDPLASPAPNALTDTCSPLQTTTIGFGTAPDGTVQIKAPAQPGTYTWRWLFVAQRDADGDGHENALDPCPLTADPGWNPRAATAAGPADVDGDGLPSSCDPNDRLALDDQDGDGYLNRGDNCPLVANGVAQAGTAAGNQTDTDGDGIGDACDPHPTSAQTEGAAAEVLLSQDVTIGGTAAPAAEAPLVRAIAPPETGTAGLSEGESAAGWWFVAVGAAVLAAAALCVRLTGRL